MTFDEFVSKADAKLQEYGLERVPEQEHRSRPNAGWRGAGAYAWLFYDANDTHYPIKLSFARIDGESLGTTVIALPQMPIPLKLDDHGARTAALQILQDFGIDASQEIL